MSNPTPPSLHPLLWIAGLAVLLFSLVGLAALMGWIPTGNANNPTLAQNAQPSSQPNDTGLRPPPEERRSRPHKAPAEENSRTTAKAACKECGVIESIQEINHRGKGSGIGAIGGAVLGGVLGNQVGKGNGNDAATVVGAVGGAVAGNEVEKRVGSTKSYQITVRFENGSSGVFEEATASSWRVGDQVKVVNGALKSNN
ncbi:MAG: glycine zipper 2TM domain-containing protein [Gallionellaceae bacterium]|nr:glycine zipper 2TM domain-containing protein [Gallionellaceae bacterium]